MKYRNSRTENTWNFTNKNLINEKAYWSKNKKFIP